MQFAPKNPVPVFPLPGLVLFPRAVVPLHVFELRYRTLVREALSGERMIAMALLKPGWERDYQGSPEFFELGCLARFEEVEWLPNDCYDLKLIGISRVRLGRVVREFPYRAARVELMPQEPYSEDDPLVELEKRALLDTMVRWRAVTAAESEPIDPAGLGPGPPAPEPGPRAPSSGAAPSPWSPAGPLSYELLVNAMCMVADFRPPQKLELLGLDSVLERGHRVREMVERHLRRPRPTRAGGGEQN